MITFRGRKILSGIFIYLTEVTFTDLGKSVHDNNPKDGKVDFELMSEEMVLHHYMLEHIEISDEPVKLFVCPMIKIHDET